MDTILLNGDIYLMDPGRTVAEAIGIEGGRVARAGSNEEVLRLRTAETKIVDLKGKTVLPGFNDSHTHLLSYGYSKEMARLDDCRSMDELVETTRRFISQRRIPPEVWVEGRGWDQNQFDMKTIPTRRDLDRISEEHSIVLGRTCGQMCVANTRALRELGLDRDPPQPDRGTAETDENGVSTGLFTGSAVNLVYGRIPKLGTERVKAAILAACEDYVSAGITSLQTDDFELERAGTHLEVLQAYAQLVEEGQLPIRVNLMCYLPTVQALRDFLALGCRTGDGGPMFRVGPAKTDTDGSLGARTAAMEAPYTDDPATRGELYYTPEQLAELARLALDNGMGYVCDAIGDRAHHMVLEAYRAALAGREGRDLRLGIDHCQITDPAILAQFKELGVVAGLELGFLTSDIYIAEDRLGRDRAASSYAWGSFVRRGIPCCAGSDNPVEPFAPLHGIQAAVTRRNWDGEPPQGWHPEEKLTVEQAVALFTSGGAYATFEEDVKGTLEPGKYADLVVLDRDIFHCDPGGIEAAQVLTTMTGGKIVYQKARGL